MSLDMVYIIVVIIFSAIVHEVMHGVAADRLGDPTARYAGRLTLNPIPHIDLYGSIIVPVVLTLLHSPIFFAWAKPVPYNPYNLRPGRFSEAIVAGAGPLSNIVIALLSAAFVRLHVFGPSMDAVLFIVVLVNVMLAIFNLIPIPPLDGSKVLEAFLPRSMNFAYTAWRSKLEMNPMIGMAVILLFIYIFGGAFGNLIYSVASAIAGV
ncbi:site-2 protease family protein [Candidatus Kaiserbacteria bacterium]|nr:site-2 protease family protein [Candidatus Kaiserbacteria bacterium]